GTFDDGTNTGTFDGYFSKLEYIVVHGGKTVADVKVNLNKTTSFYTTVINLCSSQVQGGDDDDDDDDGHHMSTQCSTHLSFGDQVKVVASLTGMGTSGKGTANNVTVTAT